MKALSIHQPWAWAILHAGKHVENRSWATKHRGPMAIHASKSKGSYDKHATILHGRGIKLPDWDDLPRRAIIGVVDVVDCVPAGDLDPSHWIAGPWCWVLANPRLLAQPLSWGGNQRLFDVPDELIEMRLANPNKTVDQLFG